MSFDFRHYACPEDDHRDRFEDWVEVYRYKNELANSLGPRSIFEVGVRYGYAAIAFLDACPQASYVGVDTDDGTWGGTVGALHWAEKILAGKDASIVVGDGLDPIWWRKRYDLVHLDGPQDEASWLALLRYALPVSAFVLLDGTNLTEPNRAVAERFEDRTICRQDGPYGQALLRGDG